MSDHTLLPILMSLAPSGTLTQRYPHALAAVLAAHGIPANVIQAELDNSHVTLVTGTNNNRSRIGSLNEFCFHAEAITEATLASTSLPSQ